MADDFEDELVKGLSLGTEWDTWLNTPFTGGSVQTNEDEEHLFTGMGWEDMAFAIGLDSSPYLRRNRGRLGLMIAIQCADVKARDIAKVEFRLWKRKGAGWDVVEPKKHWLARMIARRPNAEHTWSEFWRMTVMHLEIAQNAYVWVVRDMEGTVQELIPIPPARCRRRVDAYGVTWYEVGASTEWERAQLGGRTRLLIKGVNMIHLRGRLMDGMAGMSNAQLGDPVFDLLNEINSYQRGLFGNDGRMPLVFETEHEFDDSPKGRTAFNRLREQLKARLRRTRANGEPLLLDSGIKAKPIALKSDEALTTETYNQQVSRVCALMQTPPHKIYHYEAVKYNNQASADNQYANDCLVPLANNIEEKFRNALLDEEKEWDDYWPEFDRMMLISGDPISMAKLIETGLKNGALEINEVRVDYLGRSPIAGGDTRMVPVNMWLLDRDNKIIAGSANAGQGNGEGEGGTDPSKEPADGEEGDDGAKGLRLAVDNG